MKRLHFFLLLAGILLTACGGDDDVTSGGDTPKPVTPSTPTSWSLEITSPVTRGLSGDASGITPTWSTSDKIYVYYENQRVGVLHPKEDKSNAKDYVQLEGNLDTPVSGAYSTDGTLSFYYQCDKGFSNYTGQDGTLATIASSFDYHVAENVAITAVDAVNRKVTVGQFNLKPQQAIARFSFTRPLAAGDVITITGAQYSVSATLKADVAENTGYVDVALPLTATAASPTLTFDIKRGDDANFYKTIMVDKSMQNGKTYSAHLLLAVELNGVWWATRNLADPQWNNGKKIPDNEYVGGHFFQWGATHTRADQYDASHYDGPGLSVASLYPTYDAAYKILGRAWRMPTKDEADKLANLTWNNNDTFTNRVNDKVKATWVPNGVNSGMKFSDTSNENKYIFLKAGGWYDTKINREGSSGLYLTSTRWPDDAGYCARFDFNNDNGPRAYTVISDHVHGFSIRPVLNTQ